MERIFAVCCDPSSCEEVRDGLRQAGIPIESADLSMVAENDVVLDLDAARKVLDLVESIEEHDEVQAVSANFDIPDHVLTRLEIER